MRALAPFLFAVGVLVLLYVAARRATTILVLVAENGRVVKQRGRAPGEMLRDLSDVLSRARASGTMRLRLEGGEVAVDCAEMPEGVRQQIRNVVGRFPAARLKQAPRVKRR
ncbi:MAG: DUF3634 family protein [Polyangiaceae bacterium]